MNNTERLFEEIYQNTCCRLQESGRLRELFESSLKLKEVSEEEYAKNEPWTYFIKDEDESGITALFSLPVKAGVANYIFWYDNLEDGAEIHFGIQEQKGVYSLGYTGLNNAPEVLSSVIFLAKLSIQKYKPATIRIVCKDGDSSRKRVYTMLAQHIGKSCGYCLSDTFTEDYKGELCCVIELTKST